MASVNMAIVVGFVGDDPRVNSTQSGRKVASFSLATTEKGYTTQSGQQIPDKTEWHNIVCWGKTAEVVEKFVRKGSSLYIQGKIRTRSYEKDGQNRYVTEIECETMQMLDRRAESQQSQSQGVIPDKTEWHNIVCWGKTAEVVEKFVRKGSSLYIQGKIRTRSYEKDGQNRYVTEIECETMQMLDRRAESQQSQSQGVSQYPVQRDASFTHAQEQKKDDEDLPF
nr:single strand DNA binding protein [Caudoviricetes sp.]